MDSGCKQGRNNTANYNELQKSYRKLSLPVGYYIYMTFKVPH